MRGTLREGSVFGRCFKPSHWPDGADDYDDLSLRLRYGCHYGYAAQKLYLAVTLRRAVEKHIVKHRRLFGLEELRSFIRRHVQETVHKDVADSGLFCEVVPQRHADWLFNDLVYQTGTRLMAHGRARCMVVNLEAVLSLAQERPAMEHDQLSEL